MYGWHDHVTVWLVHIILCVFAGIYLCCIGEFVSLVCWYEQIYVLFEEYVHVLWFLHVKVRGYECVLVVFVGVGTCMRVFDWYKIMFASIEKELK